MDVMPGENPGSALECDSQCRVSDNDRPHRLETESSHIQEDRQPDGSNGPPPGQRLVQHCGWSGMTVHCSWLSLASRTLNHDLWLGLLGTDQYVYLLANFAHLQRIG